MGESAQDVEAYLSKMLQLLKIDGVRFPNNKQQKFSRLDAIYSSGSSAGIHAEGRWVNEGQTDADWEGPATVGVVFGPQYGPITAKMVEEVIRPAARRYEDLVFAGFSFDGPAHAAIEEGHPRLRIHIAHIRPDVNPGMNGLLKERPGSQLFTVFGQPRTRVDGPDKDGMYTVTMEGVDVYNPVSNTIIDTGASKVAAWFVDGDYDGRTFCITQAFFPDPSAWEKLSKALDGVVDPERFEAFSGTVSLPFAAGKHKCAAVKVIDPRGNEVMRVHRLGGSGG
jgi:adenine-specific DNA-methyltransferase